MKNRIPLMMGGVTALLGIIALTGWQARFGFVAHLRSESLTVPYGTTLAFVLAGLGLIAANGERQRLTAALGGAVALLAGFCLQQYLLDRSGSMAPIVSLVFLTNGAGLVALSGLPDKKPNAVRCFIGGLAGAGLVLGSGLALLGYLVDLRPLFDWDFLAAMPIEAAIGFGMQGLGLMILAYRHAADEEGKVLRGIAAAVVAIQLGLTLLLFGGLLRLDEQRGIALAKTEVRSLGERFETVLHERAKAIDRMAERWEIGGGTPHPLWDHDAAAYYNDMPGLQTLLWADNQGRVRWVVPNTLETGLSGFDLTRDAAQRKALEQAQKNSTSLYSGPTLFFDGHQGVLLVRALRVGGRPDGYLVAAFDAELFLSRLMQNSAAKDYGLDIIRSGMVLYRHGKPPETNAAKLIRSYSIGADDDTWEIRLWPIAGGMPSSNPLLPWLVLFGGLALTAFTAVLFISWARGIRAALRLRLAATVFENSREAISITDPEGNIVSVNRAFTTITGYTAEEALGKNHRMLQSGRQDTAYYDAMWAEILRNGYWAGEIWNRRKNGDLYPQAFSITQVKDAQNRPLYYIGMAYDITERKRREDALIVAKENAEIASQAKSQFLSSMSHELRTPLNAVLGFAQLLEMDDTLNKEQRVSVAQILTGGNQLLELVTEILNLSRIEDGDIELTLAPVACKEVVDECLTIMAPLAQNQGIQLESDGLEQMIVLADRMRLRQVVLNLLSNAIKFNRPGGLACISGVQLGDGRARLEISDTGRGIAPELMGRLFNPFERHETSPYLANSVGAGIGLAVCKRLVEAMHGSIDVMSEVNAGSTFRVTLPLAYASSSLAKAHEANSLMSYDI